MGWSRKLDELFVALDSHYTGKISEQQLLSVRICFLSQVSKINQSLVKRYKTLAQAFKAIDDNGSGAISTDEFTEALERLNFKTSDTTRLFRLLDVDLSGIISKPEFELLNTLTEEAYCKEIREVVDHATRKYGSLAQAFNYMVDSLNTDKNVSNAAGTFAAPTGSAKDKEGEPKPKKKEKSVMQKAGGLLGKVNIAFKQVALLKRSEFKQVMAKAGFTCTSDPLVLFQLLDFDGTGAVSMVSWKALGTMTAHLDRVRINRLRSWLSTKFETASDGWSAMEKAKEAHAAKRASQLASRRSIEAR
jgi:hypothetical protein